MTQLICSVGCLVCFGRAHHQSTLILDALGCIGWLRTSSRPKQKKSSILGTTQVSHPCWVVNKQSAQFFFFSILLITSVSHTLVTTPPTRRTGTWQNILVKQCYNPSPGINPPALPEMCGKNEHRSTESRAITPLVYHPQEDRTQTLRARSCARLRCTVPLGDDDFGSKNFDDLLLEVLHYVSYGEFLLAWIHVEWKSRPFRKAY